MMFVSCTGLRQGQEESVLSPVVLGHARDGLGPRQVRLQLAAREGRERIRRQAAARRRTPVARAPGAYVTANARRPSRYLVIDVIELRLVRRSGSRSTKV